MLRSPGSTAGHIGVSTIGGYGLEPMDPLRCDQCAAGGPLQRVDAEWHDATGSGSWRMRCTPCLEADDRLAQTGPAESLGPLVAVVAPGPRLGQLGGIEWSVIEVALWAAGATVEVRYIGGEASTLGSTTGRWKLVSAAELDLHAMAGGGSDHGQVMALQTTEAVVLDPSSSVRLVFSDDEAEAPIDVARLVLARQMPAEIVPVGVVERARDACPGCGGRPDRPARWCAACRLVAAAALEAGRVRYERSPAVVRPLAAMLGGTAAVLSVAVWPGCFTVRIHVGAEFDVGHGLLTARVGSDPPFHGVIGARHSVPGGTFVEAVFAGSIGRGFERLRLGWVVGGVQVLDAELGGA